MNFPVWNVDFGLPLLIAFMAIPHVMVAHFAIGGGLFLAIYGGIARKTGDSRLLQFVRFHSRFFLLLTLVFGAITGVGIWFTIGLIHPAGTSALIHTFVWFWATEWVMFFVEITAALVYFYGWERLHAKTHQAVIWTYFIAAWGSLAVINAIITFMLTSGTWPQDRLIWPAIFNPTYFPSLLVRTFITFLMAGIFGYLSASFQKDHELRRQVGRISSLWTVASLLLLIPAAFWYFKSLPPAITGIMSGAWQAIVMARQEMLIAAYIMLPLGLIGWFIRQPVMMKVNAFLMILAGLAVFGGFEWFREAARKPFVISGYMYSNGVLVSDTTAIKTAGYTGSMKWKHSDPSRLGEDLFRNACQSCHSIDGYNGLADKLKVGGYTEERLVQLIPRTGYMRGAMPPFLGTAEEAALIAGYVASKAGSITVSTAQTNPEHLWKINCGLCHTIDGFRPLRTAFTGMSHSDIKDAVLTASELSDAMPPFYGSDADADKIATYIETQMTAAAKGGNQ